MSPRPRLENCIKCGNNLCEDTRRNGNQCRECVNAYYREWSKTEKARIKTRRASEKYRQTEHGKRRRRSATLQSDHGISIEQFEQMLEQQNNECSICGKNFTVAVLKPSVDHCHASGRIRGLLCQPCNVGLGWFRDDTEALTKAVEYLEQFHVVEVAA